MSINDLIQSGSYSAALDSVEMDPLREVDALQEAQLLDSRMCHLTSTAAFLFELRTSLQFDAGNSALLVVRGLRSFVWNSSPSRVPLMALTVVSSFPDRVDESFRAKLAFFPEGSLVVEGDLAEFYVLEVEGIGDVPPDYSNMDLMQIQDAIPSWSSECSLLQVSNSR